MVFSKPALSLDEQICQWRARGLIVADEARAKHYLKFIGYYRLKAYATGFHHPEAGTTKPDHTLCADTTFEQILNLYIFDRELRLLLMDAIERIEVAVRSAISNLLCETHGPHWYLEPRHFVGNYRHGDLIRIIEEETGAFAQPNTSRRKGMQPFLAHYFKTYTEPKLPPSWMICEALSFSTWSLIFEKLGDSGAKKAIANTFRVNYFYFEGWLHALVYLRNLCAHHSLVWNRTFTIVPPAIPIGDGATVNTKRLYIFAVAIHMLLRVIAPETTWAERLNELFKRNPDAKLPEMGFPEDWTTKKFWNIAS